MIIIVTTIACFTCGVIGYFVGWITARDGRDPSPAPVPGEPLTVVTARESYDFWEEVRPGAHARSSPRVTAGGGFPALPAAVPVITYDPFRGYAAVPPGQPPLGELVQPGRTTDFIDKVRADTDRWLAARGLVDS